MALTSSLNQGQCRYWKQGGLSVVVFLRESTVITNRYDTIRPMTFSVTSLNQ